MKNATDDNKRIVFTTFDLSAKVVGFGNGSRRVTYHYHLRHKMSS